MIVGDVALAWRLPLRKANEMNPSRPADHNVHNLTGEKSMKRIILTAVVLTLLAAPAAHAQLGYGVHVGGAFASYTGLDEDLNEVDELAPGFNLGATVTYDLTDVISEFYEVEGFFARANVGYANFMPANDEFDIFGTTYTFEYSLAAIYIEVLAQYYVNENVYGMLGLGTMPYSFDATVSPSIIGFVGADSETKTGPVIGAGFKFSDKLAVEALAGNSHLRVDLVYMIK